MPPTTTYMYVCWEVRQLLAEGRRFPPPIKLTRHDMTLDVESGVKHHDANNFKDITLLTNLHNSSFKKNYNKNSRSFCKLILHQQKVISCHGGPFY